jgi:hypothetical protein
MELTVEELRGRLASAGLPVSAEEAERISGWANLLVGQMASLRAAVRGAEHVGAAGIFEPEPATVFTAAFREADGCGAEPAPGARGGG